MRWLRRPLALVLTLVIGGGVGAPAYSSSDSPTEVVHRAARRVLERPNSARLHVELALAYYARGAANDFHRYQRHLKRAAALDSKVAAEAERRTSTARPGYGSNETSEEEKKLDERLAATIPEDSRKAEFEEQVRDGLSKRMAKTPFFVPVTDFDSNYGNNLAFFGLDEESTEREAWQNRIRARDGSASSAVVHVATRVSSGVPELMNLLRLDGFDDTASGQSYRDWCVDGVDIFLAKGLAMKAFVLKRNTERALECLVATVSASQALSKRRQVEEAERSAAEYDDDEFVDEFVEEATAGGEFPQSDVQTDAKAAAQSGNVGRTNLQAPLDEPMNQRVAERAQNLIVALSSEQIDDGTIAEECLELATEGWCGTPLLVDVNGNGRPDVSTTLMPDGWFDEEASVTFDLDGYGREERVEWLEPCSDGLLAVDADGNGVIDSGRELFGNAHGDLDGWARLRLFDIDGDGWVSGREALELSIWVDDGDGRCQPEELYGLAALGIDAVSWRATDNRALVNTTTGTLSCWDWHPEVR